MKIDIKPQDKTPLQKREFLLHPKLLARLSAFAQSLNGSDENYVLSQILEQALPPEKTSKPAKTKAAKETAIRAA